MGAADSGYLRVCPRKWALSASGFESAVLPWDARLDCGHPPSRRRNPTRQGAILKTGCSVFGSDCPPLRQEHDSHLTKSAF